MKIQFKEKSILVIFCQNKIWQTNLSVKFADPSVVVDALS